MPKIPYKYKRPVKDEKQEHKRLEDKAHQSNRQLLLSAVVQSVFLTLILTIVSLFLDVYEGFPLLGIAINYVLVFSVLCLVNYVLNLSDRKQARSKLKGQKNA